MILVSFTAAVQNLVGTDEIDMNPCQLSLFVWEKVLETFIEMSVYMSSSSWICLNKVVGAKDPQQYSQVKS